METNKELKSEISGFEEEIISFSCQYLKEKEKQRVSFTVNEKTKYVEINSHSTKEMLDHIDFRDIYGAKLVEAFANEQWLKISYMPKRVEKNFRFCGIFCCNCYEEKAVRESITFLIKLDEDSLIPSIIDILSKVIFYNSSKKGADTSHRKFLIYINPLSGKGLSNTIFEDVKPILGFHLITLDNGNLEFEVFRTTHYKHAYEHTLTLEKNKVSPLLISIQELSALAEMELYMK